MTSLAFLSLSGAAAADEVLRYGPAPAWVSAPLTGAAPRQDASPGFARWADDEQYRFTRDGVERHYAYRIQALSAETLGGLGGVSEEWDPATETLTINRLHIVRDGQVIDVLGKAKFQVLRRERNLEDAMLDGRLTAALQIEDLRVGDVVDFAFTVVDSSKLLAGRGTEASSVLTEAPTGSSRLRVLWDKGSEVRWKAGAALPKPQLRETAQGSELLIEATDKALPRMPADAPARYYSERIVQFGQVGAWREVSSLMAPLFDKAATLSANSPLKAEAARIRAEAKTPEAQASLALRLVEDRIRYVAITMDAQGYTPAAADETWRRRFGDCKGKTALLMALLHELGIEAQAALVHSEDGDFVGARLPGLNAFDHVIVRATIGGRVYWLDGTRLGDGPIETIATPGFAWALPLTTGGAELERIVQAPLDRPDLQSILRIDASRGFDQAAPTTATLLLRGDEAIGRAQELGGTTPARAQAALLDEFGDRWSWARFDTASWSWSREEALLTVTLKGRSTVSIHLGGTPDAHIDMPDSERLITPVKLRPADEDQEAPYAVPYPGYYRYVSILKLPTTFAGRLQTFGEPVREAYGGYQHWRTVAMTDGYAVMTKSFRTLTSELTPAQAAEAVKIAETISARMEVLEVATAGVLPVDTRKPPRRRAPRLASLDGMGAWAAGLEAAAAKDFAGADAAYEAAAQKGVTDPQLTIDRVNTLIEAQQLERAAALLRAEQGRLSARPFEATTLKILAFGPGYRGDEILTDLDRQIAAKPTTWAHTLRARARAEREDLAGAERDLEAASALQDDDPLVLTLLAEHWGELGRWDRAEAAYRRLLAAQPDDVEGWRDLALAQQSAGRGDEALRSYDEALRIDPLSAAVIAERANLLIELGRKAEAMAQMDEGMAMLPDNLDMLNAACWSRATLNLEAEKGLAACEHGLKLSPRNGVLLDSRGFAKLRLGRTAEALADYEQAVKLEPEQMDSLYGRGVARIRLGEAAAGQADLAAAEKREPGIGERWKGYGLTP